MLAPSAQPSSSATAMTTADTVVRTRERAEAVETADTIETVERAVQTWERAETAESENGIPNFPVF